MTLQNSGSISANNINTELGKAGTTTLSLDASDIRALANKAGSGTTISYSDFYGKSSEQIVTITSSTQFIDMYSVFGSPTQTNNTYRIIINAGIVIGGGSSAVPFDTGTGWPSGSVLVLENKGTIRGAGGAGGDMGSLNDTATNGGLGGGAINMQHNLSINNGSGFIYGAGGGGASFRPSDDGTTLPRLSANGGGGQGSPGGGITANTVDSGGTNVQNPTAGNTSSGGSGGTVQYDFGPTYGGIASFFGGSGGTWGTAGGAATTTSAQLYTTSVSTPGGAGASVKTNGNSVTWVSGNNSTRVKGPVT